MGSQLKVTVSSKGKKAGITGINSEISKLPKVTKSTVVAGKDQSPLNRNGPTHHIVTNVNSSDALSAIKKVKGVSKVE